MLRVHRLALYQAASLCTRSPCCLPVASLWPPAASRGQAWFGLAWLDFDWLGSVAIGSIGSGVASSHEVSSSCLLYGGLCRGIVLLDAGAT